VAARFVFLPEQEAIPMLRAGGFSLSFRRAVTDRSQVDTGRRGDRAGQRKRSEAGRVRASRLGEALRALQIPVAEVLTSEVFRARDRAELAFGAARMRLARDPIADERTPGSPMEDARAVFRRLAEPVGASRLPARRAVLSLGRPFGMKPLPGRAAPP
jgi:hypothetical protein